MSENLIESVASQLSPPVMREPLQSGRETDGGMGVALPGMPPLLLFADDDVE
jgi:hypothetical protein